MHIEEEREARREFINLQTALQRSIHVGQPIGNSKRQFLHRRCPCLANMIAADADRIPARHMARAKLDGIRHQAHRWLRWEKKLFLGTILLEDVVLQRAPERSHWEAALLRVDDIHGPDNRSRAIDRHRGRDFVQRQSIEQHLHVGQRRDGHAAFAELARGQLVIRVVTIERWHIKSGGEAGLSL